MIDREPLNSQHIPIRNNDMNDMLDIIMNQYNLIYIYKLYLHFQYFYESVDIRFIFNSQ